MVKLIVRKKSGRKFPNGELTCEALRVEKNMQDPKQRPAYVFADGTKVNCEICEIIDAIECA